MARITYYVQRYRPAYEAISKEVMLLANHFKNAHQTTIHDLHLDGLFNFGKNAPDGVKLSSYHFAYYPFTACSTYLMSKNNNLNHIYTSLGDLPYLSVLDLKNTILTAAASCSLHQVKKRLSRLQQLRTIIVETEHQRQQLLQLGISPAKIKLILPPVSLQEFSYTPALGKFTLLYASCPTREEDFAKRGIFLLCETAKGIPDTRFHFLWREKAWNEVQRLPGIHQNNITLTNTIIHNTNDEYAKVHATIIPYTEFDDYLKLIPNSAIESLAAGKPVLVSSKTEIAKIVSREQCGAIFEPTVLNLQKAVGELQRNYAKLQQNARPTAEKYFSKETYLKEYGEIYKEILS